MRRPSTFPRTKRYVAAAVVLLLAMSGCVKVPKLEHALANARQVAQTTKVYASDGSLIAELHGEEDRELIPLEQVPLHVRDAILAIEDARFYDHPGVDAQGVMRALTKNAAEGRVVEGGSTVTQQLVKNTLIDDQRTLKRKINEAVLAYQLEQKLSKDEILEQYVNTVYFGRGAYGIQAAAQTFFQKDAKELNLTEGALLAGLIRSPTAYDPRDPKIARGRRNIVLNRMLEEGWLTPERHEKARRAALRLRPKAEKDRYPFPYWIDFIKDYIFDDPYKEFRKLGNTRQERINSVFKGGLRIYTTLQPRLQNAAERAAKRVLPYKSDPYTAQVAVNPKTGHIVSMVGGRNFYARKDKYAKFNLAVRSLRQPGSAFKPFTLVAALERGIPLSRVYRGGSRITLRTPGGEIWSPANYENTSFGASLSLKRATAFSVNVVYAQVVLEVGAHRVVDVASRMGIGRELNAFPAITLGTEEVSPLELATAYTTFATNGFRLNVTPVTKITDAESKPLYRHKLKRKRVLAPAVAALATEGLQEVMRSGTGRRLTFGRPVAGKTGTSENYADAWFAGYTPNMVAVQWVGFPRAQIPMRPPRTRTRVFGSSWPGEMWRRFMLSAHKGVPAERFPEVDERLVAVRVDAAGDCLPSDDTPAALIRTKTYLAGAAPTKECREQPKERIDETPNVIGLDASDARQILSKEGFYISTVGQYCPAFKQGEVCDQRPRPGEDAPYGSQATIYVSDDPTDNEVPMVLGLSATRARQKLFDANYRVNIVRRSNSSSFSGCRDPFEEGDGRVWAQSPCEGRSLGRGSFVTIYINP